MKRAGPWPSTTPDPPLRGTVSPSYRAECPLPSHSTCLRPAENAFRPPPLERLKKMWPPARKWPRRLRESAPSRSLLGLDGLRNVLWHRLVLLELHAYEKLAQRSTRMLSYGQFGVEIICLVWYWVRIPGPEDGPQPTKLPREGDVRPNGCSSHAPSRDSSIPRCS